MTKTKLARIVFTATIYNARLQYSILLLSYYFKYCSIVDFGTGRNVSKYFYAKLKTIFFVHFPREIVVI